MNKTNGIVGSGQSGVAIELSFEDLNPNEKAVVACLRKAGCRMKIRQVVEALGWDKPCKSKGNSRVRNALRRLVRSSMVLHDKEIGDGTYRAADLNEPCPRPITDDELLSLKGDINYSDTIKKSDCAFYNACLDQAISGKWEGFSCTSCTAYAEPDPFQREMDQLGLAAVQKAAELVEKYGKVHRVRGVKPGADAKRRRLPVVEETVSLAEAYGNLD